MSLKQKIEAFKNNFAKQAPEPVRAVMDRATHDLKTSGILETTIKTGDTLPPFRLKNQKGDWVESTELLKDGPLVLSFFRGAWCPYCNLEVKALEELALDFVATGAKVVLISPQTEHYNETSKETNKLSFDILADTGNNYAKQLGLVFSLPQDLREIYLNFGINVPKHNGDDSWQLPMPTRLIIDPSREILHADINPDYTDRPEPSETLAALKQHPVDA